MSGRLNHSISTVESSRMAQTKPEQKSALNSLKRFGQAKSKINAIYEEILAYGCEVGKFLQTFKDDEEKTKNKSSTSKENSPDRGDALNIVQEDCYKRAENYNKQLEAISGVLERNHMKVVFFGRTSNGKSTAINALLGDRILPTGIGHTTSCFLQVEGSTESGDGYLLTEESDDRKSVQSLGQLGNALCSEKLAPSSKVRIVWPSDRCKMLEEEVVLIDSPGIDVETDLDEWIDKFCLDSDVFVLVANAESTIMLTEKVSLYFILQKNLECEE